MASFRKREIRVLHVDDTSDFASLAASCLQRENDRFTVETASTASGGLERLAKGTYDCVVSDYEMPGLNGIEFLGTVREEHPDLPFILFTGKGSEEIASEAISAGVTDYLQKENGTDQYTILANRIMNAVEQRRAQRERQRSERNFDAIFQDPHMLVGVLAPDGTLQQANETAMDFVDADLDEVTGEPFWSTPWWADEDRMDVKRWVEHAASGEYAEFEATHTTPDDTRRFVRGTIRPVKNDSGDVVWLIVSARDITEQKTREQQQRADEQHRQELYQITSDFSLTDDEKIQQSLQLGCERLGVENGHLVVIVQETDRHEVVMSSGSDLVEAGDVTDLSRTYCRKTISANDILAVHDAETQGWTDDPAFEAWGISCYLGGKILVNEELYGTLCFANRTPREEPFSAGEKQFVDLMSRWISQILERRQHTEALRVKDRAMDAAPVGIVITDSSQKDNPLI
jgi:PAS domain S-box-containing protein